MSNEILKERGSVYGDFGVNLNARGSIMEELELVHLKKNDEISFSPMDSQAINDIVIKLVRLAASPEHVDSWEDISNYARLNVDRLTKDK